MDISGMLPSGGDMKQSIKEADYIGADGLWYCGVCKKPLQKRIHSEFLNKVVWCICDCKIKEIAEKKRQEALKEEMDRIQRLKDSSMMDRKYRNARFSNYVIRSGNEKAKKIAEKYVNNFSHMKEGNIGIVFYGPVGTGKSYTAACIANSLMEMQIPVIMTSFVKILQDIWSAEDEGTYLNLLNSSQLLIIDDFGAERDTDYALEKVYNVIDSRVRANKPMILTTNLSFDEMMSEPDIRYRRVYDRIFENCHPVEISGSSFRIMKAAQRQEKLKKYFDQ